MKKPPDWLMAFCGILSLVALIVILSAAGNTDDQEQDSHSGSQLDGTRSIGSSKGVQRTRSADATYRKPSRRAKEEAKDPEEFLAAGKLPVPPRSRELLSENGNLTDRAVDRIGLTPDQRKAVQERLDQFFASQMKAFGGRALRNEDLSDEENGIVIYDVPPAEDFGAQARDGLHQDLESLLGDRPTEQIMTKLPVDYLGYFGRLAARIKFYPNPEENPSPGDEVRVSYSYHDPRSGKELLTGHVRLPEFYLRFGSSFQ